MSAIRLLIIDDNDADRWLYKRYLGRESSFSYEYRECESGADGIALFRKEKPDCVLLDYFLSDMEGTEVLDAIAGEEVPIIVLTGQANPAVMESILAKGAARYIPKDNITSSSLAAAIAECIAGKKPAP